MKAVVQRVLNASVSVDGTAAGAISSGLLVYLGIARDDTESDADHLAEKIVNLRIFEDNQGKMNLSVKEIIHNEKNSQDLPCAGIASNGANTGSKTGILAVSQFTLLADARKGRRPYYGDAADPELAKSLYEHFMNKIREQGIICEAGIFQAHMAVRYTNDGPVTILLDSRDIISK
jgi:D-tyrosyl-tRNA(Tyr) deacylase